MKTKTCKNCGIEKPLTDYTPVARGRFGVKAICKCCVSQLGREYRASMNKPERLSSKGIPKGAIVGGMFKAEIDSELFLGMTYEVKDKFILIKSTNPSAKGEFKVSFGYVDILMKELQEIKNTYFGIRI